MSASVDRPDHAALSPADWDDDDERRYAERQADLATECGVDAESRVVETDAAGRVHYLVAGDPEGEPVVLLHGVGTHAATWLPMVPALADDYRVYAPDRPGRGLSAAPSYRGRDLREFLVAYLLELFDGLGLDRPHVVGNSLGGQQAFLLAIDHDRVDDDGVPEAFYETLAAGQRLPGRTESLRSLNLEQGSFGRAHPLFDLTDEDAFWPPEVGRPVAERMPDATFHELPDHGHVPWLEPGEGTQACVRSFLDGGE
ncbi:MAG: alpha/beta fold hydrolase [Haloarculaceae archaeon]